MRRPGLRPGSASQFPGIAVLRASQQAVCVRADEHSRRNPRRNRTARARSRIARGRVSCQCTRDRSFDPDVDASDITVEDRDGEVVPAGSVPSYPQHLEAAAVASRLPGVSRMHNYPEIALPPGDQTLTAMANDVLTLS